MFSLSSHHLGDQVVDVLFSISLSTIALGVLVSFDLDTTVGGGELEWPQEVVGLLEVGTAGDDLVDDILNAGDTLVGELVAQKAVLGGSSERDSLLVLVLKVTSLVDELRDGGSGRITISDERFDNTDHVPGGLVELDEDSIVELSQSKQLEDLLRLGGKLVNTSNSNQKGNLGLSLNEEVTSGLGISFVLNKFSIGGLILFEVFLSVGSCDLSGLGSGFFGSSHVSLAALKELFVSSSLLFETLRYSGLSLGH